MEDVEYICPWSIANVNAAEKYDGEFNDYCGIEEVSPDQNNGELTIHK